VRRPLALVLLAACQNVGSTTGGLVVVSDTAMIGPPPACLEEEDETGGESGESGESEESGDGEEVDLGTSFCAALKSAAACDHTPRLDGDVVIGECHWVTVVPVLAGTCEATVLYETCIHVPISGEACSVAQSCGQVGLGVFGRAGCDGTIEVIVNPPGQAYCAAPTDWPLCWPDDSSPECTCVCS
jgi:hypothetical protein